MAGTIVTVIVDASDRLTAHADAHSINVASASPRSPFGISDDWSLQFESDVPLIAIDHLIEVLQELRRHELRRLAEKGFRVVPEKAPV